MQLVFRVFDHTLLQSVVICIHCFVVTVVQVNVYGRCNILQKEIFCGLQTFRIQRVISLYNQVSHVSGLQ